MWDPNKPLYKSDAGAIVRAYEEGGETHILRKDRETLYAMQCGKVGKKPLVAFRDQQDALEVALWTYGQGAIPIILEPANVALTEALISWYRPDSFIGELEFFDKRSNDYDVVSFLSRVPFTEEELLEKEAIYTLWNEKGEPIFRRVTGEAGSVYRALVPDVISKAPSHLDIRNAESSPQEKLFLIE